MPHQSPDVLLVWAVAALAMASFGVLLISDHAVRRNLARRAPGGSRVLPFISVLKPLKGCDEELYQNMVAFAMQRYPHYELLCGIADRQDPAHAVVRRVLGEFPECAISLRICAGRHGLNPKVNILEELGRHARSDLILISDSNVRPAPDYLLEMSSELADPEVGLVTHLIAGVGERTAGAVFENVHSISYVARAITVARALLNRACVVGKSMLFRLSDFERLGGWPAVENLLAEDYVIGRLFEQNGYRVALSARPLATVNRDWSIARFVSRHMRWGQMRRRISLAAYLLELLFNPSPILIVLGVLAACIQPLGCHYLIAGALLGLIGKIALDYRLIRTVRGVPLPARHLWCVICKDLLIFGIWAVAWLWRTVNWRGNLLLVGAGTRLEASGNGRASQLSHAADSVADLV